MSRSKRASLIVCVIYAATVISLFVILTVAPKKDFSPTENRTLSDMPVFSLEALASGKFSKDFSDFCVDQFPFRTKLFRLNSLSEICLGKLEVRGVMIGKDKILVKRNEYNADALKKIQENTVAVDSLKQIANAYNADAVFFCVPRSADVLKGYCHPLFDNDQNVWRGIKSDVEILDSLTQRAENGEYVFYKTDHHWTSLGAYYAYCELGKKLGFEPYPLSFFDIETVSDTFYGTTYSACLLPDIPSDTITAFRYRGDNKIEVTDMSAMKKSKLYDYDALKSSSQYDFFLGGNKAHVKVESGKPSLILIKDSFANSLIPFLALHYDLDVIDPRYLRTSTTELIAELYSKKQSPSMLIVFGIDTLCTDIGF